MPSWKKVITSGSDAILNDLTLSGDIANTSGNFVLDVDGDIELNADGFDTPLGFQLLLIGKKPTNNSLSFELNIPLFNRLT